MPQPGMLTCFVILAVSSLTAACSFQSERVVEKPVPTEGTVVYTR